MKMEREKALEHKQRMSRMMEDKENFLSKIKAARSFIYEVNQIVISTLTYSVNVLQIMYLLSMTSMDNVLDEKFQ